MRLSAIPNYVKLDDDVSFQILRTNPRLSSNVKLVYDGKNIYMDAYPATPLLSTRDYQNYKVKANGLFNMDIKRFLRGSGDGAFEIGQNMSDIIMGDTYDNQFETMYWCGAEPINSAMYPQELGIVAPLYIRKKLPDYFVIFKVDGMSNTNLNYIDGSDSDFEFVDAEFDFKEDILDKAKIIKTFDLREGTPIGNYIKNYIEQKEFKFDRSIYVNFAAKTAYYYGIDRVTGVLAQRVENISEQLIDTDTTIMRMDDWITSGFERNDFVFPYIFNLEFLFDDDWTDEYDFSRYFGMYCNAIDLYDVEIDDMDGNNVSIKDTNEINDLDLGNSMYYIRGNKGDIYSFINDGGFKVDADEVLDKDNFMGFESSTISIYCEKIAGEGCSMAEFSINKPLLYGDAIHLYNNMAYSYDEGSSEDPYEVNDWHMGVLVASNELPAGECNGMEFSCNGKTSDIAKAITKCINSYGSSCIVNAFCNDNVVVLRAVNPGEYLNDVLSVEFGPNMVDEGRVKLITYGFEGGTDYDGTRFKIRTEDKDLFFDTAKGRGMKPRYLRYGDGKVNAKAITVVPYINENGEVEPEYSTLITDRFGKFVTISRLNQVEIMDKYNPVIGVLSFFPVKDFDFDTIDSVYGKGEKIKAELEELDRIVLAASREGMNDSDSDGEKKESRETSIKYGRFFNDDGDEIKSEYDYYKENIIPELSIVSKTVPFISKWGYQDDSKDSCENPYRLNTSKIFGTCNFSANTFMQRGDIMEYTHSMPYYLVNDEVKDLDEYQYIPNGFTKSSIGEVLEQCEAKFLNNDYNGFKEMFETPEGGNKRFTKKYSRFLNGDSIHNPSTLFRGVKFEIVEIRNGKEVKSSKYNGYKFSFVYVPINDTTLYFSNKVYFMKNDTFKFVVGIVPFSVLGDFVKEDAIGGKFNKAYVYGGCEGIVSAKDEQINGNQSIIYVQPDEMFSYSLKDGKIDTSKLKVKMPTLLKLEENYYRRTGKNIKVVKVKFINSMGEISSYGEGEIQPDGTLTGLTFRSNIEMDDTLVSMTYSVSPNDKDTIYFFDNIFDVFNEMGAYTIKRNINDELGLRYYDINSKNDYRIRVVDPDPVTVYDIFKSTPVIMIDDNKSVVGSMDIALKSETSKLNLLTLNRYSGYYNPIFKDILFYNDYEDVYMNHSIPYSNTSFDYEYEDGYGRFGIINNLWFHKVNETKKDIIKTLTPCYPMLGQYALDYKDYNVWASNGDMDYFTKQLDINHSESCRNISSMKNNKSMFGSKYLNVPETIEIEGLIGGEEWNDDWVTDPSGCGSEMMYKEVNNSSVDFYLFLKKRLIRYFCENESLRREFEEHINPDYSFGIKDDLDDDIKEYVEKNILKLYMLDKIKLYVKRQKMGVHNSKIENGYSNVENLPVNVLKSRGYVESNTISVKKLNVDDFDRKVTYNLRNGEKEDFGFGFVVKRI